MPRFASSFARPALAALLGLAAAIGATPSVRAADLGVYSESYSGACSQNWVFGKITNRFAYQVRHVPNLPLVAITDFQNIRETRYLPAQEDRPIGRTYCSADVILSDGNARDIWYLIEEGQGYAGIGDNVEFCVSGFDRWYVYNGGCRVLQYPG
jgi:capsid protein